MYFYLKTLDLPQPYAFSLVSDLEVTPSVQTSFVHGLITEMFYVRDPQSLTNAVERGR